MSDLDLRELERLARARPEDIRAGLTYARALARAGQRDAQVRELARLSRQGDAGAYDELARLSPWPITNAHVSGRSRRRGLRSISRVTCFGLPPYPDLVFLRGATDRALFFETSDGLEVVSHETGESLWRLPVPAHRARTQSLLMALVGDAAVVVVYDGVLELRDAVDGSIRARVALDARPSSAAVEGDRLVLFANSPELPETVVVDLGEPFGRVLWRDSREVSRAVALDFPGWYGPFVACGLVFLRFPRVVEARHLDTGALAWTAPLGEGGWIQLVDERGVVLLEGRGESRLELGLADGRSLGSDPDLERHRDYLLRVGSDTLVARRRHGERGLEPITYSLVGIDRATGETKWTRPSLRPTGESLALTDDLLYLGAAEDPFKLAAIELARGTSILEIPLPTFRPPSGAVIQAVPVERALVLVATKGRSVSFARLE